MARWGTMKKSSAGDVPTPKQAAEEAIAFMKAGADEARAASFQRYFKEPVEAYGVVYSLFAPRRTVQYACVAHRWR